MLKWVEREIAVSSLKPYERNPRRIRKEDFERLKRSLSENGYHQRIIATKDFRVIGGHQRIRALKELGVKKISVLVPDTDLSENQFRRLLIEDNLPFGEWDFDILSADFSVEELTAFGMPEAMLGIDDDEAASESADGESDDDRIIKCPKCKHEFSVLEKKKNKRAAA